jgi:aspartokinase
LVASSTTLGGFKVLKDVVRFSVDFPTTGAPSPATLCGALREDKINLPFITCILDGSIWRMTIVVDSGEHVRAKEILSVQLRRVLASQSGCVVLSVFPHRNDPVITGTLLEVLGRQCIEADALANSPSAISVVLREDALSRASAALFEAFSFSAYRTPEDWKLAQKGKERLYREVVASYQEKRPKVYGLNYREGQDYLYTRLGPEDVLPFGTAMKSVASLGLDLSFLTTTPCDEAGKENVYFCMPRSGNPAYRKIILETAPGVGLQEMSTVGTFSTTGPHFGDRYGIASELLNAFEREEVPLLGLNCTVASLRGVVPADRIHAALAAIQKCFEVPAVVKKS